MKKTKIIIPALAGLCISAAASVSGTVAWFAASRITKITAENIAVVNPEGSLSCSLSSIANTATDGSKVSLKKNGEALGNKTYRLRDASIACTAGQTIPTVYKATGVDPTTHAGTGFSSVASSYVDSETDAICYTAAWKMTFTMSGTSSDEYDITFNKASSTLGEITGNEEIYVGFRVAFMTSTDFWIWAPNDGSSSLSYVNGTTASSLGAYTGDDIISDDTVFGTIGTSGNTAGKTKSLDVYAYMWFEGTNENVQEGNISAGAESTSTALFHFDAPLHS